MTQISSSWGQGLLDIPLQNRPAVHLDSAARDVGRAFLADLLCSIV